MLTQEELKSVLSYDSITGHFYWLKGSNKGKIAGCICGSLPNQGYWK